MGTRRYSVRAIDAAAGAAWALMAALWVGSWMIDMDGYLSDSAVIVLIIAAVITVRAWMVSLRDELVETLLRVEHKEVTKMVGRR